eukprot:8896500-Ditylum_brightwellii.AAC.1
MGALCGAARRTGRLDQGSRHLRPRASAHLFLQGRLTTTEGTGGHCLWPSAGRDAPAAAGQRSLAALGPSVQYL